MQDRLETERLLPDDSSMPSNPDTLQGERKAYGSFNDDDARRDSLAETTDDEGIIPKDALDPVYEAKARVLNRAVSTLASPPRGVFDRDLFRFKILAWEGISGNYLSSSDLDGLAIICGPLSRRSSLPQSPMSSTQIGPRT